MNIPFVRRSAAACVIGLFTVLAAGCVGPGGGYGYGDGVAFGADYYEPAGVAYGGWGSGYQVAPYRGGDHRAGGGGGRAPAAHAYRPAAASRAAPSIPSRARSGGGRRP
jgi:hypothetical protein